MIEVCWKRSLRMRGTFLVLINVTLTLLLLPCLAVAGLNGPGGSDPKSSRRLAPCQICRVLVASFNAGIERTAKGHYTGGDAAWEEDNKKTYKNSELRFVEIQETLCGEVSIGKDHCHEFHINNEELLEQWWVEGHRNAGEDLDAWLCINKLQVCCPDNHFGKNCSPCPGLPLVCSGHGKCKGNGTRKGNGECSCQPAYAGEICDHCADGFYQTQKDGEAIACLACHKACKGGCRGPGAKNCESCKTGWEFDDQQGCIDANECLAEGATCKRNEFCQNTEGSYSCLACDSACDGCFGDGPDMCERCADNYTKRDKVCMDTSVVEREGSLMNTTRYLTYCGLAIVSLIVLQKNAALASVIGLSFGVYIATTEYLLTR